MIDDEFPSLSDAIRGEDGSKKFNQRARASALYEGFRQRHMICDVENDVNAVPTDRFRKSDLIILDYNLGPLENDNEQSLRILRELASSKHFNTIVVYTADPALDDVWLAIIASLSGDWKGLPGALEGVAQEHWERLSDAGTLPDAQVEAVRAYAERREIRSIAANDLKAARQELTDLGVPPDAQSGILEAIMHQNLAVRAGRWAGEPRRRAIGKIVGDIRWVQSHNSFVAIVQKTEEQTGDVSDPYGLMAALGEALLAWRPNLIQVIVSEIQNILELEALTTEDEQLAAPETQTALWYYLLYNTGPVNPDEGKNLKAPLTALIDKLVDGIRNRLSSDHGLLALASSAMLGEIRDMNIQPGTWPEATKVALIKTAETLTRAGKVEPKAVSFRLNNFLSTERFSRAYLTTGTIFRDEADLWVASSPACDLVARKPGVDQAWAHTIHPMTAFIAVKLHPSASWDGPLTEATKGNHVYLELDGKPSAWKLVNAVSQPSYEFFFAHDEGRVLEVAGKTSFSASRLKVDAANHHHLTPGEFEIVGQMREVNATRALQATGHHLSRVGLDFIDLPKS